MNVAELAGTKQVSCLQLYKAAGSKRNKYLTTNCCHLSTPTKYELSVFSVEQEAGVGSVNPYQSDLSVNWF